MNKPKLHRAVHPEQTVYTSRMLKKSRLLTRPLRRAKTRLSAGKAAASEEARRTLRYVEPLREVRTPLADFFSILLDLLHVEQCETRLQSCFR